MRWVMGYALLICVIAGCGGDAGVELAAADALHAVARSMEVTVNEYHQEVDRYDQTRDDSASPLLSSGCAAIRRRRTWTDR